MVSLDDAVIARLEKGGSRYEILVDPELVDAWKEDHTSVDIDDLLAVSEVWTDSRNGRGLPPRHWRRFSEPSISNTVLKPY